MDSIAAGSIVVFSALDVLAVESSTADDRSAPNCSTESSIGCSIMFTAIGATSGVDVEAVGCPETGLAKRFRTFDCRPCSSSESSRSTIGICVFGVELVVWVGIDEGVEGVRM